MREKKKKKKKNQNAESIFLTCPLQHSLLLSGHGKTILVWALIEAPALDSPSHSVSIHFFRWFHVSKYRSRRVCESFPFRREKGTRNVSELKEEKKKKKKKT